ncbi:MAG: AbrB/MazE/SpoVT family DNA-binding domain-containing protein [bacterium]
MNTQLAKWGHSLAVRIPKAVAEKAKLREGDRLDLSIQEDGAVVIRPAHSRYTLGQLVAGITAENRHSETDWGEPVGKEPW